MVPGVSAANGDWGRVMGLSSGNQGKEGGPGGFESVPHRGDFFDDRLSVLHRLGALLNRVLKISASPSVFQRPGKITLEQTRVDPSQ
jgi:hypothetical protein